MPAAEISASKDGQDESGLAPDAINFVKNQTYDFPFVSSAGLAPAVLTIENMMGSDCQPDFGQSVFDTLSTSSFFQVELVKSSIRIWCQLLKSVLARMGRMHPDLRQMQ